MTVLMQFSGVRVRRVLDPSQAEVAEHAHDWPLLSLYVIGGYRNITACGERRILGPSLVFYRRGAAHRNVIGETGFEQIEIEFDPAWLGPAALPPQDVLIRVAGICGSAAHSAARRCTAGLTEGELCTTIRHLLALAALPSGLPGNGWHDRVTGRLRADPTRRIADLAREVGRSPAGIGPAYRKIAGETLKQLVARCRVERAAQQLRETDQPLGEIALAAGFSDQSHMNRAFRQVLGRLPTSVRKDRRHFRVITAPAAEPIRITNGGLNSRPC